LQIFYPTTPWSSPFLFFFSLRILVLYVHPHDFISMPQLICFVLTECDIDKLMETWTAAIFRLYSSMDFGMGGICSPCGPFPSAPPLSIFPLCTRVPNRGRVKVLSLFFFLFSSNICGSWKLRLSCLIVQKYLHSISICSAWPVGVFTSKTTPTHNAL